jgi:hypothetical protein
VRKPSSNWFGVMMSAPARPARAAAPGSRGDEASDFALPITGSHAYTAQVRRLHPRDRVEDHVADALAALIAAEHDVDLAEHAALLDAGDDVADVVGAMSGPRQAP